MGKNLPYLDLGTGRLVTQFSMGLSHACAILDNGSLKCWGTGQYGALGLENTNYHGSWPSGSMGDNLPAVNLGMGKTAIQVSVDYQIGYPGAHDGTTCAVLNGGLVKCWGNSDYGQLGLADTIQRGDNPGEMGDHLAYTFPF